MKTLVDGFLMGCAAVILTLIVASQAAAKAPTEAKIWIGCTQKAEVTFYIAQERLYNGGTAQKLMEYLKENMKPVEFAVMKRQYRRLAQWVDSHEYDTAKGYARSLMIECLDNSYEILDVEPGEEAAKYWQRFDALVNSVPEMPEGMQGG